MERAAWKANEQVHWKTVNEEAVLVHFELGTYFALDPVGTFLWTKITDEGASTEELVNELVSEYDCAEEEALRDVSEFCQQLQLEELIEG